MPDRPVVVTDPPRPEPEIVELLGRCGVATIHEAMGRTGLLGHHLRPVWRGATIAGCAVTALCVPGDNLMLHAAVEQCRPGDVIVLATAAESTDGFFGELLATSVRAQGGVGLVTDTGVRDVAELAAMAFPVWSRAVSAQGTVKARGGSVNMPVRIGGTPVVAGDIIVADDDGVVRIPRTAGARVLAAARERITKEDRLREQFAGGEFGLDLFELRPVLADLGVVYRRWDDEPSAAEAD